MKMTLMILSLIAAPAFAQIETQEFEASSVQAFEMDNTSGSIVVRKTDGPKAKVVANKRKFENGCNLETKKTGSKVVVKVEQPFRKTCEVDFEIFLPVTANMELRSGSGDIDVAGTRGEIVYRVGSGNVKIDAEAKKIDGRSGSGRLEAKGLLGDVKLLTGSGNAKLVYAKAPVAGEIDIKSGSGDAEIILPKETKIISDSTIGAGKFYNELGDDKDAKFKVSFKAGAGNLKILKATN